MNEQESEDRSRHQPFPAPEKRKPERHAPALLHFQDTLRFAGGRQQMAVTARENASGERFFLFNIPKADPVSCALV